MGDLGGRDDLQSRPGDLRVDQQKSAEENKNTPPQKKRHRIE